MDALAFHGSPDALSFADLVAELRTLPGIAEGRWPYAELTQTRLATLLRPYEAASRDITHDDGRRRKSYHRNALKRLSSGGYPVDTPLLDRLQEASPQPWKRSRPPPRPPPTRS
ncbi:DUF3631 domain-containing protein [Streptomyces nojiriensis]|uniref:DUF3631 domain-containing protein n=1 Tax=Streptomyces nojiriensis TaxID=66374 RepID=UPI0036470E2A